MNTAKIREHLQESLAALDSYEAGIFQPVSDITLREAFARLAPVLGSLNIEMSMWRHASEKSEIQWTVWDGKDLFKASTLHAAVNSALNAHRPLGDAVAEGDK